MNLDLFGDKTPPVAESLLRVWPVIDSTVRELCVAPYPLHPKGCPNVGKCDRCPPVAPMFDTTYDLTLPVYAVVNAFDLAKHVARMAERNPKWSDRQLRCVLYWQQTARNQLDTRIKDALSSLPGYAATWCPEGGGVNVTETLEMVGIVLEWPPERIARQIALLAKPK